jgi:uncharacterized protein (UPF0332 family)
MLEPLPPDPEHLFQQADRLAIPLSSETEPRQTDLRRAISAAYYGLFHFALAAAADMFVGRDSDDYVAAYRSVSHDWLRSLCDQLQRKRLAKVPPHVPGAAFFGDIVKFATSVAELQDLRHRADYDPSFSITADEVKIRIAEARRALELFRRGEEKQSAAFLALLLFNIRETVPARAPSR